jgi:hypothetical protein
VVERNRERIALEQEEKGEIALCRKIGRP